MNRGDHDVWPVGALPEDVLQQVPGILHVDRSVTGSEFLIVANDSAIAIVAQSETHVLEQANV